MPDTASTTGPVAVTLTIVALLIALSVLALLALVLAGIHDEERHMSLTSAPRNRIGAVTRRLTGVGVRTPKPAAAKTRTPIPPRKRSDMTVAIPAVSLPGAGTGRDITGRPPASGLLLIMSGPAAPVPGPGSHPAPPRWSRDRSGLWLRNAAAGLCVLAAAAAAVSFTAQYRMAEAARHLQVVAALEAAIPDAAALVFACLGIALALHGRRALRARALNLASVAASVFMNAIAAAPGWRNLAIWALPPVAYALASDTLIAVVRTRHQQLTADAATPLAIIGGLILWLLRLTLAPASTLAGFRAWVLEQCPVAPGRRAAPSALPGRGGGTVPRKATKTDRFLSLVTERHGSLASIPLDRVAAISAALAPAADLNPGAARAALRKAVLAARNGDPS